MENEEVSKFNSNLDKKKNVEKIQRAYLRHELRTPINAIIGYSEMLLEDTIDRGGESSDLRYDLEKICNTGKDLLELINNSTQKEINFETFGISFRHAIRTMINTIVGYTEMLLEDSEKNVNETLIDDLMKIQIAGKQLFKLIEDFIKIEKIEVGEFNFDLGSTKISPMIQDVVTSTRPDDSNLERQEGSVWGKILVVDDNEMNRDLMSRNLLKQGYNISVAENGRQALDLIAMKSFDLVLLDLMMPEMNGYQVLHTMKSNADWKNICVIILSALDDIDGVVKCLEIGAEDYLAKPINTALLNVRIGSSLERKRLRDNEEINRLKIEEVNRKLETRVQKQIQELQDSYLQLQKTLNGTVLALSSAVDRRDPYTAGHQHRVSRLACAIAKEMGLSDDQIEGIRVAGILHDIGKIGVPAEILAKPGKISEAEFGVIKSHAETGYDILKTIDFPWPVAQIVLQHQERLDGNGYPQGLSGENILLEARIIGVADVVEAMATHRPYRPALGIDVALDEIQKRRGIAYDAYAVDACLELFKSKKFSLND